MKAQKTLFTLVIFLGAAFPVGTAAGETAAFFTRGPAVERGDGKITVRFAVSRPTDVEVALVDGRGRVVRHLAAGVLGGKNPPPPPLRPGLSQAMTWDLRDDFGEPVSPVGLVLRVRLGMRLSFGGTIGGSPYVVSDVRGLATDGDGNLYVVHQSFGYGPYYVTVFDPRGRYLKTVLPPSAGLPRETLSSLLLFDGDRPVMKNFLDVYPAWLPLSWKDSRLILASANAEHGIILASSFTLFRFRKNGEPWKKESPSFPLFSRDRRWPGKKHLAGKHKGGGRLSLVLSPDGCTLYAAAWHAKTGKDGKPLNPHWPAGGIYRMNLDSGDVLSPWKTLPCGPVELKAVDGAGNIYLYATAQKKLVRITPGGKEAGSRSLPVVTAVACHPRTGAVYVLCAEETGRRRWRKTLLKFDDFTSPAPAARLDLGTHGHDTGYMAVAAGKEGTVVWLAGIGRGRFRVGRADVTAYADGGTTFTPRVKIHEKDPDALGEYDCIAADPTTEDVYINDDYKEFYRYNGITGAGGSLRKVRADFAACDLAVGPRGRLYVRMSGTFGAPPYSGSFERLDRDLKPVPFPATGTHVLSKYIYSRYGAGYGEKGIGVGRDGRSYVTCMYDWTRYCTIGFGPDGKALPGRYLAGKIGRVKGAKDKHNAKYPPELTSAVIGPVPRTNGGLRVDSHGNIYIGVGQLPAGTTPPPLFARDKAWRAMVGSVVKFPPGGGRWIRTNPKTSAVKEPVREVPPGARGVRMEAGHFAEGALRVYTGIAPFSGSYGTGRPAIGKAWCDCRSARFDIDFHDRLWLPNAVENRIRVYDNSGNVILESGGYANYDSQYLPPDAKKPRVPTSYVPLGWPIGTAVTERHLYVCDQLNRCVVRLDISYLREKTCPVR